MDYSREGRELFNDLLKLTKEAIACYGGDSQRALLKELLKRDYGVMEALRKAKHRAASGVYRLAIMPETLDAMLERGLVELVEQTRPIRGDSRVEALLRLTKLTYERTDEPA